MEALTQLLIRHWPEMLSFILVLGRISGLVISAPFWGGAMTPRLVRAAVILGLSIAVYPLVHAESLTAVSTVPSLLSILSAVGREVLIGLVLGWAAQLLFIGIRLAGQQMEMKMGLGLSQLIDPQDGGHTSLLPAFLDLMAALVFLSANGHHLLIHAFVSSYRIFPLGGESVVAPAIAGPNLAHFLVMSSGEIFAIAFRVSAPVVIGLLLTDVLLGIVSRVVPQMNLFAVILPVQFAFGVFLLLLALPVLVWFCVDQLSVVSSQLSTLLTPPSSP